MCDYIKQLQEFPAKQVHYLSGNILYDVHKLGSGL